MAGIFLIKKRARQKQLAKSREGFSLIELLIAMVILLILLIAFTPLFMRSLEMISYAGDKSEALHLGQSDMEVTIAEKRTVDGYEMVLDFGDTVITIPGGLVDVEKSKGSAESFLSGFVPYVPSINHYLNPLPLVEGYDQLDIILMGRDTDFGKVNQVKMYNREDVQVDSYVFHSPLATVPDGLPEGYDEYGYFTLLEGLRNEQNPFITEVEWMADDDIKITARARLQVVLPYAVAAGSDQSLVISPDAYQVWKGRNHNLGTGLGTLNDIVWTGFEYIAVTGNGNVILWRNKEPVKIVHLESGISWHAITSGSGLHVAVGSNGKILSSWNGETWLLDKIGSCTLFDIAWNDNEFMVAGSDGLIFSSPNGESWSTELSAGSDIAFHGITYGNGKWLAVGKDIVSGEAVVYQKNNGEWEESYRLVNAALFDVAFSPTGFIAVGENGLMVASADGEEWEIITTLSGGKYSESDLYAIVWDDIRGQYIEEQYYPQFIVVGAGGTILTKISGDEWETHTVPTEANLRGVAVR